MRGIQQSCSCKSLIIEVVSLKFILYKIVLTQVILIKELIIYQHRSSIKYVTYGIWQVMLMNGLQKPLPVPTIRVLLEVALTNTAATALTSVSAPPGLLPMCTLLSGLHFI